MERYKENPGFDVSKCNGCGLCTDVCACHSFVFVDSVLKRVETSECDFCQQCELV